jgi:hypothetical protein
VFGCGGARVFLLTVVDSVNPSEPRRNLEVLMLLFENGVESYENQLKLLAGSLLLSYVFVQA